MIGKPSLATAWRAVSSGIARAGKKKNELTPRHFRGHTVAVGNAAVISAQRVPPNR
jgi:hypothetical protein